jgi:glycosyltransferase involved in cell wall biosynthesis
MNVMQVERPRAALNAQLLRVNEGYRSAGIARYLFHLLRELDTAASDFQLDVYATEPLAPSLLANLTIHTTRFPVHKPLARIVWEQTVFAYHLLQKNYALLHSLAYVSPLINRTRSIVTLYDLSFYLYPEYFRPLQRLYLQIGTRISARRAQRIITISESTKRDAVRLLNLDVNSIDVAMPGVDAVFFKPIDANALAQFRREKNLPDHFVLFLGTREPRKNIPSLLRAFALAKRRLQVPHYIVLAGGRGWMDQDIPQVLAETGLTNEVIFPGFVPDKELPFWYRAADVFVYPSQYEGFGMPALEALASGTPVITSNVSSLPEAVGNAALLIDPKSPEEIADALVRVLNDEALRYEMQARGVQHARQFTWTRAAHNTAQSYRRALDLPNPFSIVNPVSS